MESYGSGLGGAGGADSTEIINTVKQQLAIANAQALLEKMSEKCFHKCIIKPGSSLDHSEQKCVSLCMDRYIDSWNLVQQTYSQRIQREGQL